MHKSIEIHPKVQKALEENKAVVALESTIISHGMPYPENVKMAKKVAAIIEEEGAVPATILMMDGIIKIGVDPEDIETFAQKNDVQKLSKRDLAFAMAQKQNGATTVSATMLIASMAGIAFFATGGIGGVHRGAEKTFDISRDLEELASVDVCVVCAGAKCILDLPLTLEYLETKGVPVLGYQTNELPAFFTRESGFKVPLRADSPEIIARTWHNKRMLNLSGGMVIANPVPSDESIDKSLIDTAIEKALEQAEIEEIHGKALTPYLLSKIETITKGKSLKANLALVYNNARLAAKSAIAYANIKM
jgi:pseudouridine-5'-phosphate glycosidase